MNIKILKAITFYATVVILGIHGLIKPAPESIPTTTVQNLFQQALMNDDMIRYALAGLIHHVGAQQTGMLIRLAFEQNIMQSSNSIAKQLATQRYVAILQQCASLQQEIQLPLITNLFCALTPDTLIRIASIDGGITMTNIIATVTKLLTDLISTSIKEQKALAIQLWIQLLETFGAATLLKDNAFIMSPALSLASTTASLGACLLKLMNASQQQQVAHQLAQIARLALEQQINKQLIADLIAACARNHIPFDVPDRITFMETVKKQLSPTTICTAKQLPFLQIDQAFMLLSMILNLYGNGMEDSINLSVHLRNLEPMLNAITQDSPQSMIKGIPHIIDACALFKTKLLMHEHKEQLDLWLHNQLVNIIDQLLHHQEKKTLTIADMNALVPCIIKNLPAQSADRPEIVLHLLCAQTCIKLDEQPMAYDLLRALLTSEILQEDTVLIQDYAKVLQLLLAKEIKNRDTHLLDSTINHLVKPIIKRILQTRQDHLATNIIMHALKALRNTAEGGRTQYYLDKIRLNLIQMLTPRLLDAAQENELDLVLQDLNELSAKQGFNDAGIEKRKADIKNRREHPYMNNGFCRWMLNGLSRRKRA